ncbi:hypothetical protein OKW29_000151 [Paraburkholderia sp. CI3]
MNWHGLQMDMSYKHCAFSQQHCYHVSNEEDKVLNNATPNMWRSLLQFVPSGSAIAAFHWKYIRRCVHV